MSRLEQGVLVAALAAVGVALAWTAAAPPAHAQVFTEDPLQAHRTPIRAMHISQIRSDIDILRTGKGLSQFNWTDLTLAPCPNCVKAVHVTELRRALNEAGGPAPSLYKTDPDPMLVSGVSIKADHLNEVRGNIRTLFIAQHLNLTVTPPHAGATVVSGTATPNASVQVFVNGTPRGAPTTADALGRWTVSNLVPPLAQNDSVTARETVNGVTGDFSAVVTVGPVVTQIAFVHIDGDCGNLTCKYNLRLMDPQNPDPSHQTAITDFPQSTITSSPVWSRDFSQLAFASTLNSAHSLELASLFTMDANGANLQQITGHGIPGGFPPSQPTGTVRGRVAAQQGSVVSCSVTAQGMVEPGSTSNCQPDGTFVLNNVPMGAKWVLASGRILVDMTTPSQISATGFVPLTVTAGQMTDVGTITMAPAFFLTLAPSFIDATRLLAMDDSLAFVLDANNRWVTDELGLPEVVNTTDTTLVPTLIPLPQNLLVANPSILLGLGVPLSQRLGCDWSPVRQLIACGFAGADVINLSVPTIITGGVLVMSLDGGSPHFIDALFFPPLGGPIPTVPQVRWSPDGSRIAFVQASTDVLSIETHNLFVINADGGTPPIQLIQNPRGNTIEGISWSPDGGTIAFDSSTRAFLSIGGNFPVQVPTATAGNVFTVTTVGSPVLQTVTTDGRSFGPAWRSIP